MTASDLYREGKLAEAIAAMNDEVKKNPSDPDRRAFLADLLCITGNFDRADVQLEAISKVLPAAVPTVSLVRQLVRAEQWRQQCFGEGRVPELLAAPDERLKLHLQALVELRAGDDARAAELLAAAEEQRPRPAGVCDGVAFDEFRDADDLCGGYFEVLTSTGKYYWVPIERVRRLSLRPIERPRDLLWRRAGMEVADGPEGEVYLPLVYAPRPEDAAAQLGRVTEWSETEPVRGTGLRTFVIGDEPRTLTQFVEVEFDGGGAA